MELTRLPKIKVNTSQLAGCDEMGLQTPIMGYEIRQSCTRHTEYKVYVHYTETQGWFVYRRYREFYKLRNDLKKLFPDKVFTLPPKRYFGDNYEPRFLNNRRQGLQGFLYMITRQREILKSSPVVAFLALDNPPTINDDIEQCRAVVEHLESTVDKLKADKAEQHANLTSSNSQIVELHDQKHAVLAALRCERQQNGRKYYPGDDLSLMFEYRSLPEVCRVDVSSFLVRKPPAYLARKFEDKARKFEDKSRKFDEKLRKSEEKSRNDDIKLLREHDQPLVPRSRAHTPSRGEHIKFDSQKESQWDKIKKSQPQIEIKRAPREKKISLTDMTKASSTGEFQSLYDLQIRRKSMPGALEWHKVANLVKVTNTLTKPSKQTLSLEVPDTGRPRSFSAGPTSNIGLVNRNEGMKRQVSLSLESPKRNVAWSSLKDLRKLKTKV